MLPKSPIGSRDQSNARTGAVLAGGVGLVLILAGLIGAVVTVGLVKENDLSVGVPVLFGVLGIGGIGGLIMARLAMVVAHDGGAALYWLHRKANDWAKLTYQHPEPWQVMEIALKIERGEKSVRLETMSRYLTTMEAANLEPSPELAREIRDSAIEVGQIAAMWLKTQGDEALMLHGNHYDPIEASELAAQIERRAASFIR